MNGQLNKAAFFCAMKKFIYYNCKIFHFEWENPFGTMNKLKGIFKPLKTYFIWGRNIHPPIIYCSKPKLIFIRCRDVEWKDKWKSPRYEEPPHIWINLFGFNLFWYWDLPDNTLYNPKKDYIDDYWEQALWYLYYTEKPNINRAKETWPWRKFKDENSWNDKFLVK